MFSMRVSFTVKVSLSVVVIQVAILSCNCVCEATQPRRYFYEVDTEPKVVTKILCLGDWG